MVTEIYLHLSIVMFTAKDIESKLVGMKDETQRINLMRFFKTDIGSYGEGDEFIGLKVPQTRSVVKEFKHKIPLNEIEKLLFSRWHEVRLSGFLLLVEEMTINIPKKNDMDLEVKARNRENIVQFYIRHASQANNWDLVDLSCPKILGVYLRYAPDKIDILYRLAKSNNLWEQRIAMVSNWMLIRYGIFQPTIEIADILLEHSHDLIHKSVGWMLRELGKKDERALLEYLDKKRAKMSRTTLRYAIEKLPYNQRQYWLKR